MILTTAVLSCMPGAPSATGCLAAFGRQARLRQAAAGAPAKQMMGAENIRYRRNYERIFF
ncbi:hypothetical protein [Escherichia coli]|uniref:hypothetical protein n=1 Tax=Escherichia coli TaxID=562 RepID=UPI0020236D9C|nr:hypothetical protein [Escherichia coli]